MTVHVCLLPDVEDFDEGVEAVCLFDGCTRVHWVASSSVGEKYWSAPKDDLRGDWS